MKKTLSILLVFLLCKAMAQHSFGAEFGTYYYANNGVNDLDSIRVVTTKADLGEMFGGVFYEVSLLKKLKIHNKLLLRPIYNGNIIFNYTDPCLFCPVLKSYLSPVTNLSLEVLPQYQLANLKGLKIKVFSGINTSFNFRGDQPNISFNGRHPGVALVMNSLDRVVKPVTFSWIYGASIEYWRVSVWWKYQHQSEYSKEIEVANETYRFSNTWSFLSISLGYSFYSSKKDF